MESQELYDKYQHGRHWDNHPTAYAERFAQFLANRGFSGLLIDVGCGTGRDVHFFSSRGFLVTGIDYSDKEIALARARFSKERFEIQNAEELKFQNESVGAIFMINVIHYLNQKKALEELFRILRPGGYVFIHFNLSVVDDAGAVDYSQSERDILELLSKFSIVLKNIFERFDRTPTPHTHKVLELILQK